jgi:superfamily II DNA/RNA helicase
VFVVVVGKTLAYVLPLLSKLSADTDANIPSATPPTRSSVSSLRPRRPSTAIGHKKPSPQVLVLVPSRELARQVGKEFERFAKSRRPPIMSGATATATANAQEDQEGNDRNNMSSVGVVTVYGGVPIERHVSMLKRSKSTRGAAGLQVLVATPGRLRELIREGHLNLGQISTLVLDEADVLLDKGDSPDVYSILQDLERDLLQGEHDHDPQPEEGESHYQLVMVSATMNRHVVEFAKEMKIPPTAMIRIRESLRNDNNGSDNNNNNAAESTLIRTDDRRGDTSRNVSHSQHQQQQALVQHWHIAAKASFRTNVAIDLITLFSPLLTIVFVPSKAEAESVAASFSSRLGGIVRVLHGDMVQSARSLSIALIQQASKNGDAQILVATDVASRGIDLPVDLVIQFGIPRQSGKEGTYNTDLYIHRVGRTGRVRSTQQNRVGVSSNAVLLYDPEQGEGKLIQSLRDDVYKQLGLWIEPKRLPSVAQVVDASYDRILAMILPSVRNVHKDTTTSRTEETENGPALNRYFFQRLKRDLISEDRLNSKVSPLISNHNDDDVLLSYLAGAITLLSKMDPNLSPLEPPPMSLLSASPLDRTIRVWKKTNDGTSPISPPEVSRICKALGSGKLGKIVLCEDGSAVFDLSAEKARKLMKNAVDVDEIVIELPWSLPAAIVKGRD